MSKEICKTDSNCSFVYPILEGDNIGNSLSSINYNFRQLDIQMCNIETDVNTKWLPAFTIFSENSASWYSSATSFEQNSACWSDTSTVVQEMSSYWLKPITLVYPYPFTGNTDISTIRAWLVENFTIEGGGCFNFIVGQEFYIFSPEYYSINRKVADSKGVGKQTVSFTYTCTCISKPTIRRTIKKDVDCGTFSLELNVPDQFINRFVGIKFVVLPSFEWDTGTKIYE
jgi:hypothetical protein